MVSVADIMVENKIQTKDGVICRVSFYDNVIVDDFENRELVLDAVVCENSDGDFSIISNNGYDEKEIYESVCKANKTKYMLHYYDIDKQNLMKKEVVGLKAILDVNRCNNVIDAIKV